MTNQSLFYHFLNLYYFQQQINHLQHHNYFITSKERKEKNCKIIQKYFQISLNNCISIHLIELKYYFSSILKQNIIIMRQKYQTCL
ncbi:hypothetical protein TTHERM_000181129 (macronuclear) [Tetrahymena thermophila SB210]|uniref:Uncharacterized protein n=1 Tax=Tetrahymena thermophila (strain SB210) TaxID=312017 RepID=W7X9Y0_TETTS|nr:hypothetical protein TTHERM_000181129 [Tetrahymena thermophila SB210]EWS76220.1 hypothetical protein TTHERM_000181129 [Tetrahymena thermophila SB210]|eukprot:XP_012651267.1 hypothetical protein TTHERM_000181129 [Tetrahymena thermophila SB210]